MAHAGHFFAINRLNRGPFFVKNAKWRFIVAKKKREFVKNKAPVPQQVSNCVLWLTGLLLTCLG
ncbi:hypothetical protein SAMN05421788_11737 [Filimonas lacunae]|uniref:Uncharacterized protein n=1 Tax=Filimonas lacunae TaxID=477680 RepID=A0A1N7RHD7_9BACT|nr:hypothetical protein SAMN05421788_11737 [Filimonas lacunae]